MGWIINHLFDHREDQVRPLVPQDLEFAACVRISYHHRSQSCSHYHLHESWTIIIIIMTIMIISLTIIIKDDLIKSFPVRDSGEATGGFGERVTYFTNKVEEQYTVLIAYTRHKTQNTRHKTYFTDNAEEGNRWMEKGPEKHTNNAWC